nr:uncharacterized protein LOC129526967 isoform X2 [Gorilla gorilla gorilla]
MVGAPPPASLPPCSLISDCCASNQRDSVGVGPSKPVRRTGYLRWKCRNHPSSASLTLGAVDPSCSYSAILAPLASFLDVMFKPGKCANIKVTWVCWSLLVFGLLKMPPKCLPFKKPSCPQLYWEGILE